MYLPALLLISFTDIDYRIHLMQTWIATGPATRSRNPQLRTTRALHVQRRQMIAAWHIRVCSQTTWPRSTRDLARSLGPYPPQHLCLRSNACDCLNTYLPVCLDLGPD